MAQMPEDASRDAQKVQALLEDFRSRWLELLNFESEVSRWFTLYLTAAIAIFGWVMGNKDFASVQTLLKGHDGLNAILVVSLALLNGVYVLILAFNGYRIQQIGQYLYSDVGLRLTKLTKEPFNTWEDWRRTLVSQPSAYGPEWIRKVYFTFVGMIPFGVSCLVLGVYWWAEGRTQDTFSGHNWYAYFVAVVNVALLIVASSTTAQNGQWSTIIKRRLEEEAAEKITRAPNTFEQPGASVPAPAVPEAPPAIESGQPVGPSVRLGGTAAAVPSRRQDSQADDEAVVGHKPRRRRRRPWTRPSM